MFLLIFTSKYWPSFYMYIYLCANQEKLSLFVVCGIFRTFACSHHMPLILEPN